MRDWVPAEENWSDLANDEVMATFDGRIKTRAVAMCVWCMAQNPSISLYDLETLARRDPKIEPKRNGDRINSYAVRQARFLLGIRPDRKRRKSRTKRKTNVTSSLSSLELALLDRFKEGANLVDEYVNLMREMGAVNEAVAKAHEKLLAIPFEHAMALADVDPEAAEVLARQQVLAQLGEDALQQFAPEKHATQERAPETPAPEEPASEKPATAAPASEERTPESIGSAPASATTPATTARAATTPTAETSATSNTKGSEDSLRSAESILSLAKTWKSESPKAVWPD